MASRKKVTILLALSLFFSVFLGSYHHCCDCYSNTCLTCTHAGHQPFLLTTANAADQIQPFPANACILPPEEIFPTPFPWYAPLKGRAPPRCS